MTDCVVDASAVVDLLLGTPRAPGVAAAVAGHVLWAPAHLDAEVLSAIGRLVRGKHLSAGQADRRLRLLGEMPLERVAVAPLIPAAWRRRGSLQLLDALYVVLADERACPLVTCDRGLAAGTPNAVLIS